jgi:hypothetical protein
MEHQAFAQLLGNYGEFVGAIAVMMTLGYLTYQVRQNTRSMRRTEYRAAMEQYDRWRTALQRPENADLYIKGQRGQLTDESDQLRFQMLITQYTYAMQNTWDCVQSRVMDQSEWERLSPLYGRVFSTPGGAQYWERHRAFAQPKFVNEIDAAIGKHQAD